MDEGRSKDNSPVQDAKAVPEHRTARKRRLQHSEDPGLTGAPAEVLTSERRSPHTRRKSFQVAGDKSSPQQVPQKLAGASGAGANSSPRQFRSSTKHQSMRGLHAPGGPDVTPEVTQAPLLGQTTPSGSGQGSPAATSGVRTYQRKVKTAPHQGPRKRFITNTDKPAVPRYRSRLAGTPSTSSPSTGRTRSSRSSSQQGTPGSLGPWKLMEDPQYWKDIDDEELREESPSGSGG